MMDTLDNHFGDDASLDSKTTESIKAFLVKNSAETSTKDLLYASWRALKTIKPILPLPKHPFGKIDTKIDKAVYAKRGDRKTIEL